MIVTVPALISDGPGIASPSAKGLETIPPQRLFRGLGEFIFAEGLKQWLASSIHNRKVYSM